MPTLVKNSKSRKILFMKPKQQTIFRVSMTSHHLQVTQLLIFSQLTNLNVLVRYNSNGTIGI
jgi:hypothetical protein